MADVHAKLDDLSTLVTSAKAMPLSASCVLPRADVLAALDEVRQLLPSQLAQASDVLAERADVVAEGRVEADRIIAAARVEQTRLVAQTAVSQEAARQADRMISDAREQSRLMRAEVEDYVDGKLANFEVVLAKTLSAVERGRDKLRGRVTDTELQGEDLRGGGLQDGDLRGGAVRGGAVRGGGDLRDSDLRGDRDLDPVQH